MDPNAALRGLESESGPDTAQAREYAEALYAWLAGGGFEPNWIGYPVGTSRYRRIMGRGKK